MARHFPSHFFRVPSPPSAFMPFQPLLILAQTCAHYPHSHSRPGQRRLPRWTMCTSFLHLRAYPLICLLRLSIRYQSPTIPPSSQNPHTHTILSEIRTLTRAPQRQQSGTRMCTVEYRRQFRAGRPAHPLSTSMVSFADRSDPDNFNPHLPSRRA